MTEPTSAMEVLEAFIAEAKQQYAALEHVIAPLDEKLELLRPNWRPRHATFWGIILNREIPAIRAAANNCSSLFSQKGVTALPALLSVNHISYSVNLTRIECQIEECGILLTAYIYTFDKLSVEQQIRERQRIMRALDKLSKAVYEATQMAYDRFETLPEELRILLHPLMEDGI